MINIIAIGKKHEPWVVQGVERYCKRLVAPFTIQWVLLQHSAQNGAAARQQESRAILQRLQPTDYVILLDERGQMVDSPAFSAQLGQLFSGAKKVVMVIGGAYGVSNELMRRADAVWSLSPLVFPHQLVRLLVAEQIYRAQQITRNSPYHHE